MRACMSTRRAVEASLHGRAHVVHGHKRQLVSCTWGPQVRQVTDNTQRRSLWATRHELTVDLKRNYRGTATREFSTTTVSTKLGRNVLSGISKLQRLLNQERSNLAATPLLLIESSSMNTSTKNEKQNSSSAKNSSSQLMKHVQLSCTSVGLRTATFHPTTTHFPLVQDVDHALEYGKRMGALETIVGIGDSGAIELAKAVAQQSEDAERLLLVPGDLGATLLASSRHALVLDPMSAEQEPALLPYPTTSGGNSVLLKDDNSLPSHLILSDVTATDDQANLTMLRTHLYAGIVFALDALYQSQDSQASEDGLNMIKLGISLIEQLNGISSSETNGLSKEQLSELQHFMVSVGSSLSFGLPYNTQTMRSQPLALAASLVTTEFPDYSFFQFVACLLPGMLSLLRHHPQGNAISEILSQAKNVSFNDPQCPRFTVLSGDDIRIHALLSKVHAHSALWDCRDASDEGLEHILRTSLESVDKA